MFAESSKGYSNFSHDVHGAGLIGLIDQRKWQLWVNGKSSTTGDRSGQQKWQRWVNVKSICDRTTTVLGPVVSSPQNCRIVIKKCESRMNEWNSPFFPYTSSCFLEMGFLQRVQEEFITFFSTCIRHGRLTRVYMSCMGSLCKK